jgi:hypothetical protein
MTESRCRSVYTEETRPASEDTPEMIRCYALSRASVLVMPNTPVEAARAKKETSDADVTRGRFSYQQIGHHLPIILRAVTAKEQINRGADLPRVE